MRIPSSDGRIGWILVFVDEVCLQTRSLYALRPSSPRRVMWLSMKVVHHSFERCEKLPGQKQLADTTLAMIEGDDVEKGMTDHSSVTTGHFVRRDDANNSFSKSKNTEPLLSLKNGAISVGGTPLLSNLNLNIHKGEIIFLTGPSGCGKSTCMKAMARMEVLDQGTISLSGSKSSDMPVTSWRTEVLYVRQNGGQGLQGTPKELLAVLCSLQAPFRRFNGEVETVVSAFASNLQQLDLSTDMMDTRWDQFSGGESQRVYLCLMLALAPSIVLLDEPTSACDEASAQKIERMVLASGITTVWVSHDPSQIERLQCFDQTSVYSFEMVDGPINTGKSPRCLEPPQVEDTA